MRRVERCKPAPAATAVYWCPHCGNTNDDPRDCPMRAPNGGRDFTAPTPPPRRGA